MREFTLKAYDDVFAHQVIHMDQGLCYNPEYRATQKFHDYPSRKLQLAWAIDRGELTGDEATADIVFQSILSRDGERWQNFRENPEDYTDVMLLCRDMLVKKGFCHQYGEALASRLEANNGHLFAMTPERRKTWIEAIPVLDNATTYLLLDDATAFYVADSARALGGWFAERGINFAPKIAPVFPGFEYFAYGEVDKGVAHLKGLVDEYNACGATVVYTLSGQVAYLLTTFCDKLGIARRFEIVDLLDTIVSLDVDRPSFVYGGSFYARYLDRNETINRLLVNTRETKIQKAPEFLPIYDADKRVNSQNMWQKPLGSEYLPLCMNGETLGKIAEDALGTIIDSKAEQVICFEPYAYGLLMEKAPELKIRYYFELL